MTWDRQHMYFDGPRGWDSVPVGGIAVTYRTVWWSGRGTADRLQRWASTWPLSLSVSACLPVTPCVSFKNQSTDCLHCLVTPDCVLTDPENGCLGLNVLKFVFFITMVSYLRYLTSSRCILLKTVDTSQECFVKLFASTNLFVCRHSPVVVRTVYLLN